jgi:hypothetical protein
VIIIEGLMEVLDAPSEFILQDETLYYVANTTNPTLEAPPPPPEGVDEAHTERLPLCAVNFWSCTCRDSPHKRGVRKVDGTALVRRRTGRGSSRPW